ncbi:uncharacterized protein LOC110185129 [Drosophila serrata]|uniref:uncharacterized protein LOC110185129 n=1 Tax=Drosophila serrata TaxID=7274 RepID=UPI000A1D25B7|nr:uncharacterized protein LOC110185129 [Drosophila serrata]KAH8356971.1 hypothetical protein KR200_009342 [Drosophila serrata]
MPETEPKLVCSPSNGLHQEENAAVIEAANRLVIRSPTHRRSQRQRPPQGRRDATGFTANQEVKLKAGDMRIAQMQICISQLRTEMEESTKQLKDLCKAMLVDAESG